MSRELSCYYEPCQKGDFDDYDNTEHVDNWISIKIQPHNMSDIVA
jgi:hypothetical protein